MTFLLKPVRKQFPEIKVAVNSHDLLSRSFGTLARQGTLFKRLPWKIELARIKRFERNACHGADVYWTITQNDAEEYRRIFSFRVDGVFSRGVDDSGYHSVSKGQPNVVVHVGTADLRKGTGLQHFVNNAWPVVRARVPEARLVLAGRGTERFSDSGAGIEGLGFVGDDRDVLGQGMIFLNSQNIGAGLQFKSIIAMLAGKALVSTSIGIEGIEGNDGEHFFVADAPEDMATRIVSLMNDPALAERTGERARSLMLQTRAYEQTLARAVPLVEGFAALDSR